MSGYVKMLDCREYHVGQLQPPNECFRCGICCTRYQPRLSPEEVKTIAETLGLSIEDFLYRYAQSTKVGYLLRQSENGCVFVSWEEDNARASCSIYPFRPESCRNWVPSLSRPECREGLTRLKAKGKIMFPEELYPYLKTTDRFYSALVKPWEGMP